AAHNGDVELARVLLIRKPDLDVKSPDNDGTVKNGQVAFGNLTALHLATASGSQEIVKLLLDAGAAVDPRDVRGLTPLAWAVGTDRPQARIIRLLLAKGADSSGVSKYGESARGWGQKYNSAAVRRALKMATTDHRARA